MSQEETPSNALPTNFIQEIIDEDNRTGKFDQRVHTRFPPEPNGYLHIGHAKSICLNFGLAIKYGGKCNLRFDDTNPTKEDVEYVDSIQEDVRWLGFQWDNLFYASDYFEKIYEYAERLIEKGLAYVDSCTIDEIRQMRGTLTHAGQPGPYRDRPIAENLDLFRRMRAGEFPDGTHVLRAKFRGNGRMVLYENVPQHVYDALIFADSITAFFRDKIEGAYPARELRDARGNDL